MAVVIFQTLNAVALTEITRKTGREKIGVTKAESWGSQRFSVWKDVLVSYYC